jgi:Nucleotidyltransferase/DNA polymerase involved in DNA repair
MKPPKSWLSDYSKSKTKKDGVTSEKEKSHKKSFGRDTDDSFRHYMARKIDLQRQQFGLVLPPDPKRLKTGDAAVRNYQGNIADIRSNYATCDVDNRMDIDRRIVDPSIQPMSHIGRDSVYEGTRDQASMSISQGMNSVLSRLKDKHKGFGSKKKLAHRKMKKNRRKKLVVTGVDGNAPLQQQEETTQSRTDEISQENRCRESVVKCTNHQEFNTAQYVTTTSSPQHSILDIKRHRRDLFFLGITVLVNGYTDPCADTIMRLMHKHGGDLEKYETSRVTHIIADNLSAAKAKIYKKQRNPIPVVKPKWIVDCVNAGKLLPHADYLLNQIRNDNVGLSVKAFFTNQPSSSRTLIGDEDANQGKQGTILTDKSINGDNEDGDDDNSHDHDIGLPLIDTESSFLQIRDKYTQSPNGVAVPLMTQLLDIEDCNVEKEESITPLKAVVSEVHENSEENLITYKSPPTFDLDERLRRLTESTSSPKKVPFSARTVGTDPNFLDSYFKSSRLSFIGSFKQRLEKAYQCRRVAVRSPTAKRYVFHVDMDCFFAAVALRNYPQYKDKPVAVGHAWKNDPNGVWVKGSPRPKSDVIKKSYSELSTCNYKARERGVKKGMFLHRARELCPDLIVLPYDYDGYEDASNKVSDVLYSYVDEYHGAIEQVSCDESYLEFYFEDTDNMETIERLRAIGDQIRKDIIDETDCTASIGIGNNKLLAKLATNHVKEKGGNGIFIVNEWKSFLQDISLANLPGVGYKLNQKLRDHALTKVCDIWDVSEGELSQIIGPKTASKLWKYCHGHDDRLVKAGERKTIGAECNYGVRFDGPYGVDHMIRGLAKEVERRMSDVGVLGRHITLKVKVRQAGAGQPGKFNGHGLCDDHSRSCKLPGNLATKDSSILATSAIKLYSVMELDKNDIRGMGIVISNLEIEKYESEPNTMSSWLRGGGASADNLSQNSNEVDSKDRDKKDPTQNEAMTDMTCNQVPLSNETNLRSTAVITSTKSFHKKSNLQRGVATHREIATKHKVSTNKVGHGVKRYDGRYRQFDVKCMLNLASIKSGEKKLCLHGEEVSLTQLDALPLELQLQVANNNCDDLSMPSFTYNSKGACPEKIVKVDSPENRNPAIESSSENLSSIVSDHDTFEDIVVLNRWMDDNKIPSESDIQKVVDFLNICIAEKRIEDTIKFLRLIRYRSDAWGENYIRFLNAVDIEISSKKGRKLDIIGLGL